MSYEQKTHWNFKCIKLFYIYFWPGIKNRRRNTIGYLFPGERSACCSADMLLRQYKRVRRELGKKFHYRDIKKVYTIVLFEKSNSVFKSFSKDIYIHRFQQQSDSGIELNLLQEYTFICLAIFDDIIHNEGRNAGDESGERIAGDRDAENKRWDGSWKKTCWGGGKGTDPVEGRTGKTEKIDEIHSDISCFLFTLRSWSVIITVKTAGRHLFEDFDNRKR